MKIIVTEFQNNGIQHLTDEAGNIVQTNDLRVPTGKEWEFNIPIEPVQLGRLWRDIKGDIRELIQLAKNSLRR